MTDEVTAAEVTAPTADPAAVSLTERAQALVAQMEHNMANNAPISMELIREVKALLGLSGE